VCLFEKDRRTEASTAVFEDDRLSFESTDVVAPQELREWESYKNYSSSIDKFDFNDVNYFTIFFSDNKFGYKEISINK